MEETLRNLSVSYEHYLHLRKLFGLEDDDERGNGVTESNHCCSK